MGAKRDSIKTFIAFGIVITTLVNKQLVISAQSIAPDNLLSTAQIVVKSCYFPGVSSEKVAWQFFGCYDHAPGKDLFVKCQKSTFNGVLFNSVRNIRNNCQPLKLPTYARCLMRAFRKSGLDMNAALRKLNACQLRVLSTQK